MGEIHRTASDAGDQVIEVPLLCQGEQREIGRLRLTPGRAVLTPELIAGAFAPSDPSYHLRSPVGRRGEMLLCPRCGAPLLIAGAVQPPEVGPDDARRGARRPGEAQPVGARATRDEARSAAVNAANALTRAGTLPGGRRGSLRSGRDQPVVGSPGMADRDKSPIRLGSTALELRA